MVTANLNSLIGRRGIVLEESQSKVKTVVVRGWGVVEKEGCAIVHLAVEDEEGNLGIFLLRDIQLQQNARFERWYLIEMSAAGKRRRVSAGSFKHPPNIREFAYKLRDEFTYEVYGPHLLANDDS